MTDMDRSSSGGSDPLSGDAGTGSYGDTGSTSTYDTTTGSMTGTAGATGTPGTAGTTSSYGTTGTSGTTDTSAFATPAGTTSGEGGQGGREWVGQLQGMIDNIATQAAPVLKEIAAKAAELAATAGEKAGPIAHKAAEVTEAAGTKLAERGRVVASDLRRGEGAEGQGAATGDTPNTIEPGASTSLSGTESTYPSDTTRTVAE